MKNSLAVIVAPLPLLWWLRPLKRPLRLTSMLAQGVTPTTGTHIHTTDTVTHIHITDTVMRIHITDIQATATTVATGAMGVE